MRNIANQNLRNKINLTLVHRFCTNVCLVQFHCLHQTIFTDTMFASTQYRRSNKYAQIFSSDFGWLHAYPIKLKGEEHDAPSLIFQREGVPPLMIMNSSKDRLLASSAICSVMLAVRRRPQNLTLPIRMLLSKRLRNSRKEPAKNCSLPTCPGN